MTLIKEVFKSDVTRNISPVIYFREQSPEKLQQEVEEYIITGGFEGGPKDGIHEQFVRLLKGIHRELTQGGRELPACWISGFYGSGKSSFAKLLGLSLDHRVLPGGQFLHDALLARDDSPQQAEFREAWEKLTGPLKTISVVFDIGAIANRGEGVHLAVRRELAKRLGYSPGSQAVADYVLKLELDGEYPRFLQLFQETHGRSWESSKARGLVEDEFSEVMSAQFPTRFENANVWADSKTGSNSNENSSVEATVRAIQSMLAQRAPEATVFIVVDEVSQYIHSDDERMLALQSFVSALGQQLHGRVWLMATGQQKLEEELEGSNLSKLKDRFPNHLRVHLSPANIRDVVHRRLLKKDPAREGELRQLYQQHGARLRNNGYGGERISEKDFLEIYPMLPGQVDLLMKIASNLRVRSSRMKGDDHAIRGLLQLLGELFREKKLGELELGHLVTLEHIYDVQATTLDTDIQDTMARLLAHPELESDSKSLRVAKAVALLELVADDEPAQAELVARCLYARLGDDNPLPEVKEALEKLSRLNFVTRSEKRGYRIQSSAGQEWVREKEAYSVTGQAISDEVKEVLGRLRARSERPRLKGRVFDTAAFYSDGKMHDNVRIHSPKDQSVVAFDFQFLPKSADRAPARWINESSSEARRHRVIWVVGECALLRDAVRELLQSQHMLEVYSPSRNSLSEGKRACFFEEQNLRERLLQNVEALVDQAFLAGSVFFQGKQLDHQKFAGAFAGVLHELGEEVLPQLYQHFVDYSVSDTELEQLFDSNLSGASDTFRATKLGILEVDSGRVEARCNGEIPTRILDYLRAEKGAATGAELLTHFSSPPYGYYPDLVKASVLGLLRGHLVKLQTTSGLMTSYNDMGCRDIFLKLQEFKRADIVVAGEQTLDGRTKSQILRFFEDFFPQARIESDPEAIVNAVFQYFPQLAAELREFYAKVERLRPLRLELPAALDNLQELLEKCRRGRQAEPTLQALKKHIHELRDGVQYLRTYDKLLFEKTLAILKQAQDLCAHQWAQLHEYGCSESLQAAGQALEAQLKSPKPWEDLAKLEPVLDQIRTAYRTVREELLQRQFESLELERQNIRSCEGFHKLGPAETDSVLRPFQRATGNTSAEATYPTLVYLRDTLPAALERAREEALEALDQALADIEEAQTLPFELKLQGEVIRDEADVERLLARLRERLLEQLKNKVRVRLK